MRGIGVGSDGEPLLKNNSKRNNKELKVCKL